jgi:hypothetical protein
MRVLHRAVLGICWATATAVWVSLCVADPSPQDTGGTIEPEVTGIGAKISIAGERFIAIHRQSRNQNIGPTIHYFHKPLFILKSRSQSIADYPPIVLDPPRQIGDKTFVNFGLILTTAQFQEDARAFVIANDPELKQPGSSVDFNGIRVDAWPIITLRVRLVEPLTGSVLGEWLSPSLEAASQSIAFPIGMTADSLAIFKRYAASGDLQFTFAYTFRNVRQQYAAALSTAAREINQALQQTVSSANIAPGSPIFQTQANEFRNQLSAKLVTQISASSVALVPLVQSQLADRYLKTETVTIDNIQDKALLDAIYGYLRPLLQTAADKRTKEKSTSKTHEEGTTIKLGAKPSVGPVGGDFEIDRSDKDTIATKTGITLEYSQADQAYEPQSIKVYKLSNITDQETVQVVSEAFISQGGDPSFQDDTPIRSDFTDARVGAIHPGDIPANFSGVLPGMAFCFFGNQVPKGYVELTPSETWPDAAWVPNSLRGQHMPDGQNNLIGITRQEKEIGQVWSQGKIDIGQVNVPATGLTINQVNDSDSMVFGGGGSVSTCTFVGSTLAGCKAIRPFTPGDALTLNMGEPEVQPPGQVRWRIPIVQGKIVSSDVRGAVTATIPKIELKGINTTPQHVRCRLIVRE